MVPLFHLQKGRILYNGTFSILKKSVSAFAKRDNDLKLGGLFRFVETVSSLVHSHWKVKS